MEFYINLVAALWFSTRVVLCVALCGQDSQQIGEGGAEQLGRTNGEEKTWKAWVVLQGFCSDTNLTTEKERGNFSGFFNEWSLPPAKTTCSPPLELLLKRQPEHFSVNCSDLLQLWSLSFWYFLSSFFVIVFRIFWRKWRPFFFTCYI